MSPANKYSSIISIHAFFVFLITMLQLCSCHKPSVGEQYLHPAFYEYSCPQAQPIVQRIVAKYVQKQPRMGAFLLRLHFHDCFVQGCDASLLLDNTGRITSEKGSNPNRNSAQGFEVIDEIKKALEKACPLTVSCADIMAIAARDSTVQAGGPSWEVLLGRKDSKSASLSKSNNDIPAPNNTFNVILKKFEVQGLDITDLVALSGSHTIGNARCTSFRQRLYSQSSTQPAMDGAYANQLRNNCPSSGGDQNTFPLDPESSEKFDNSYFKGLLQNKGLLSSDQILTSNKKALELVNTYAEDIGLFFDQFAESMIKMGNIVKGTTSSNGEIRENCRKINT